MLKFKSSKDFNNQSFQTTKEQYKLLDYINPKTNIINKKYKILRLFNQSFKIRWTRYFPKNSEYKTSFRILYDFTKDEELTRKRYHKFKENIISKIEKNMSFVLEGEVITSWLKENSYIKLSEKEKINLNKKEDTNFRGLNSTANLF